MLRLNEYIPKLDDLIGPVEILQNSTMQFALTWEFNKLQGFAKSLVKKIKARNKKFFLPLFGQAAATVTNTSSLPIPEVIELDLSEPESGGTLAMADVKPVSMENTEDQPTTVQVAGSSGTKI